MSTGNFAFENRCIVVEDDDFTFENVPKHYEYVQGSNRNYPSYYLEEYRSRFYTLNIVITAAYYSGACIDYTPDDRYLANFYAHENDVEYIVNEIVADFKDYKFSKWYLHELVKRAHVAPLNNDTAFNALFEFLFALEKVKADTILDDIRDEYGYTEVETFARFCNGEVWYQPVKIPETV